MSTKKKKPFVLTTILVCLAAVVLSTRLFDNTTAHASSSFDGSLVNGIELSNEIETNDPMVHLAYEGSILSTISTTPNARYLHKNGNEKFGGFHHYEKTW